VEVLRSPTPARFILSPPPVVRRRVAFTFRWQEGIDAAAGRSWTVSVDLQLPGQLPRTAMAGCWVAGSFGNSLGHTGQVTARPGSGYLQPSFFISFSIFFIYRVLYKILFSISHFSPTTFSKSHSLYIKPYIRNVFCSKFLYVRIYHTSNAMDIFYFYLIQCLKRKEKIEKRRENIYI
jgi:hypothetical protein